MNQYRPPLREIPSVLFTSSGWIRGTFHIPQLHGFLDNLSKAGDFLKLTDVTLPHFKKHLQFFGLRRNAVMMIIPDCPEEMLHLPKPLLKARNLPVSFLLESGTVSGTLVLEGEIRISDFLSKENRWIVLRDSVLGANAQSGATQETRFPLLLLNSTSIIGASEEAVN